METIEELKQQKREIEQKIKMLQSSGAVVYEYVKLDKEYYPTSLPDEWGIYFKKKYDGVLSGRKSRWVSVIRSTDRKKCISMIDTLIKGLQELKEKIRTEDDKRRSEKENT